MFCAYLVNTMPPGVRICSWQRPEEIIPSGRLRDHEDRHWAGRELSLICRQRFRCRHGAGSYYYYSVISLAAHYIYEMTCDMLPEMIL